MNWHRLTVRLPTANAVVTLQRGAIGGHVGLLYISETGQHQQLHLAWHSDACDQEPEDDIIWVEPCFSDPLDEVATVARLVARRLPAGRFPYAFDPRDAGFDDQGNLHLGSSRGLTCSTFVLLLFRRASIELIDEQTWTTGRTEQRITEDTSAQNKIVHYLKRNFPAQAAAVGTEIGTLRVRAEEVAAASGLSDHPVAYVCVEPVGRALLDALQNPR